MSPIALTDEQLNIVRRAAEPLQPHDRGVFLQNSGRIAERARIGDGVVARARAEAQARSMRAPDFAYEARESKYR